MAKVITKKINKSKTVSATLQTRQKNLTKKEQRTADKNLVKKLPKLPSSFALSKKSISFIAQNWRLLLGITVVYFVLNLVLVRGISGEINVTELKSSLDQAVGSNSNQLSLALSVFGNLLGSPSSSTSSQASLLQTFLLVYESLVLIWVYRQLFSGQKVGIKQAYYSSTAQLIPFVLVFVMLIAQCLPLIIGSAIYGSAVNSGLAMSGLEQTVWLMALLIGAAWTLRMLCGSIFSIYIVTLPEMHPKRALHSAKQLVKFRRMIVFRRLMFLPFAVLVAMALVVVPLIIFAAPLAGFVFYILASTALLFVHLYLYQLYRELLK